MGQTAEIAQLLTNPHFEGFGINGVAAGWANNSFGASNVRFEAVTEPEGGKAQRIVTQGFRDGAVQFVQAGIPARKGSAYAVRIRLKGTVPTPVTVRLRKRGPPYTTYAEHSVAVGPQWREYPFTLVSTADDPDAFFMVAFGAEGELFVGGASLVLAPAATDALPQVGNLVANGGFDVGLDRWSVFIRENDWAQDAVVSMNHQAPATVRQGSGKDGRRSLRVVLPPSGRLQLTSPYMRLNPGREHTLSVRLAAEPRQGVRFGLGSGLFGQGAPTLKGVSVGPAGERFLLRVTPQPAPDDAYFILLEADGPGTLTIDDVQLVEGPAESFAPRSPAEVGLWREGARTLFEAGEAADIQVAVHAYSARGPGQLMVRAVDHANAQTELLRQPVELSPGETVMASLRLTTEQTGHYRLVAELSADGALLDRSEMAVGVVPRRPAAPDPASPFGGHARFRQADLENARRLGIGWLRLHPPAFTKWFTVEPERGRYVFNDQAPQAARAQGLRILGSLDATPLWASTVPRDGNGKPLENFRMFPPADMADWERYVRATVGHYKGVIDHWEIWNEPDGRGFFKVAGILGDAAKPGVYAELLAVARRAAKDANPQAVIVGGCATDLPPRKWFDKIAAHGAMTNMDAMSFHRYTDGRPGDALEVTTRTMVDDLRVISRHYGGPSAVWETESGIEQTASAYGSILQLHKGHPQSPQEACAYLVRNHAHLLGSGVERWFYYSLFPVHRTDRAEFAGFFEFDGSPRPMAVAHAVLADMLHGARFARHADAGAGAEGEVFEADGRLIYVLWAKGWSGTCVSARVPWPQGYGGGEAVDIMGRTIRQLAPVAAVELPCGQEPVYLRFVR